MQITKLANTNACLAAFLCLTTVTAAQAEYSLTPELNRNTTETVSVSLEAGGDLLVKENDQVDSQPMNVAGELRYHERIVQWSLASKEVARSVRKYESATATIQTGTKELQPELSENKRTIAAEIRGGFLALNSYHTPLTRNEFDLVNVSGSSLALDRLLPGREVVEGENWNHDTATIAPLLGMDHVAVCEVSSVVTGESHQQVQIRLAGTVHGTIDGAPTEIELRGAYLFHLQRKRITKFNLAIKEKRSAGDLVPGLDIVAQIKIVVAPAAEADQIDNRLVARAANISRPLRRELVYHDQQRGFRLVHSPSWYIRGEQSDLLSIGYLQEGQMTAHCNISTLPARGEGRQTTLKQFETDVKASIGDRLEKIERVREWTTERGNACLGIVASGKVNGVEVQWRYFLVSAPDKPRVTLAVTVEKSFVETFADADRQLVDSLVLGAIELPTSTASRAGRRR